MESELSGSRRTLRLCLILLIWTMKEASIWVFLCFCLHQRYSCWHFSVYLYSFHCSAKTQASATEILLVFVVNVFLLWLFSDWFIRFMYVNCSRQPQTIIYCLSWPGNLCSRVVLRYRATAKLSKPAGGHFFFCNVDDSRLYGIRLFKCKWNYFVYFSPN